MWMNQISESERFDSQSFYIKRMNSKLETETEFGKQLFITRSAVGSLDGAYLYNRILVAASGPSGCD